MIDVCALAWYGQGVALTKATGEFPVNPLLLLVLCFWLRTLSLVCVVSEVIHKRKKTGFLLSRRLGFSVAERTWFGGCIGF